MTCLFCQIANGATPTPLLYQDEQITAFSDIAPKAPHHALIVPRRHIATINDLTLQDVTLTGQMIQVAQQLAEQFNIATTGYRLIFNCNADGGQAVYHIHLHLLGGRSLSWPPG